MKKFFKILLINLVTIFVFINILNWFIYYKSSHSNFKDSFQGYINFLKRDISAQATYNEVITFDKFREVENKKSKKGPVLIFGCSFAYGSQLDENETISYKIGKLTGRPVYNRGYAGYGIQHMLYQLQNPDFYKIVPRPEYIIYVYFEGHPQRITTPVVPSYPISYTVFYEKPQKLKNGDMIFKLKKRTFFTDKIIIQHYLSNMMAWNVLYRSVTYSNNKENLIIDYLTESKKEMKKHWKDAENIKFIVLFYNKPYNNNTIEKLNKMGFYTLSENDFKIDVSKRIYKVSDTDDHPSGLAWDKIVPVLIKKFNL